MLKQFRKTIPLPLSWPRNLLLRDFDLEMAPVSQRDDFSCGAACLKMMMEYLGVSCPMETLRHMMPPIPGIGLHDTHVAMCAMKFGFTPTIYTYNYCLMHPIWNHLTDDEILEELVHIRDDPQSREQAIAAEGYCRYLLAGGHLIFYPLSKELILAHFDRGLPCMAALDMAFLYDCMPFDEDEKRATHFIVINGYDPNKNHFHITDPWHTIPLENDDGRYSIDADRVVNAILLGQHRNDSALIVLECS
ncbi:MAG TPA: cysteine peptidase family C39 domain-containing protein [Candidatus Sumerlaeota bacterium]|nr:cysteine peptidase family C39 domain-containing protein [Candidatus Sumerlaeota bacterium]